MTQPISPVLTVHRILQNDTTGAQRVPLFATFEALADSFTMPAVAAAVGITVVNSAIYAVGQFIYIPGIGYLEIVAILSTTAIYVRNDGNSGNYAAGTSVPPGVPFFVCPPSVTVTDRVYYQQAGTATVVTTNADDTKAIAVTFAIPFLVLPTAVVLTIMSNGNLGDLDAGVVLYVRNLSMTGFEIWYSASGAFTLPVGYIAMV